MAVATKVVGVGVGMEVDKTGVMGGVAVGRQAVRVRMIRISQNERDFTQAPLDLPKSQPLQFNPLLFDFEP
jgi:hypothetical protein